jgi:hypothetical protein
LPEAPGRQVTGAVAFSSAFLIAAAVCAFLLSKGTAGCAAACCVLRAACCAAVGAGLEKWAGAGLDAVRLCVQRVGKARVSPPLLRLPKLPALLRRLLPRGFNSREAALHSPAALAPRLTLSRRCLLRGWLVQLGSEAGCGSPRSG